MAQSAWRRLRLAQPLVVIAPSLGILRAARWVAFATKHRRTKYAETPVQGAMSMSTYSVLVAVSFPQSHAEPECVRDNRIPSHM